MYCFFNKEEEKEKKSRERGERKERRRRKRKKQRALSLLAFSFFNSICQSFFPREFVIWFKPLQVKQVHLETSSLARSLHDLMH